MKHLICQECPNGCYLNLDWKNDLIVEVSGNKCPKGIVYASRILKKEKKAQLIVRETYPTVTRESLRNIACLWDLDLKSVHYEIPIEGSPERSTFRVVIKDHLQRLFLIEQVPLSALDQKKKIISALQFLFQKNLQWIRPYLANAQGECLLEYENNFWQIAPFTAGAILNRTEYIYDAWRGPLLADFLIELQETSKAIPFFKNEKAFSIKNYVYQLVQQINRQDLSIKTDLGGILEFLEKKFMPEHDQLPTWFCHGDYHAMNIVWSENNIHYVIDWEFCGFKPEIYDVANLIGCIGIEHPSGLKGELVLSFIFKLKSSGLISTKSWSLLIEFIIALRFAWLSEWLRRKDQEMIDLELTYMYLLIENKGELIKSWNLPK